MLLVPAPAQLLEAGVPLPARLVVGREAARVHPDGVAGAPLDGDHPGGGLGQQLPVVGDVEHRLGGLVEPVLEPALAGHVEEVVRLVEQQHLVGAAQQQLQREPLLLAAGQGGQLAVLRPVVGHAERGGAAHVPERPRRRTRRRRPSRPAPAAYRSWVFSSSLSIIASSHAATWSAAGADPRRGRPTAAGRATVRRASLPMTICRITPRPPVRVDRPGVRREVAGDDPQQRGLAGAVGADQRHLRALADPERHVVEEHPAVRELVPDPCDVDVAHDGASSPSSTRLRAPQYRRYRGRGEGACTPYGARAPAARTDRTLADAARTNGPDPPPPAGAMLEPGRSAPGRRSRRRRPPRGRGRSRAR